jgi:hypothetical protein
MPTPLKLCLRWAGLVVIITAVLWVAELAIEYLRPALSLL